MLGSWQEKRVLVTARTYPTPARKGIEVSCTAGLTADGHWIRLFPIPYRFMEPDQRFRKYQWIRASVQKARDNRRESYTPDLDSIRIDSDVLGTGSNWAARWEMIRPLIGPSMCELQRRLRDGKRDKEATLGVIKPRSINQLVIRPDSPDWSASDLERLRQYPLWGATPKRELEKLPVRFTYEYECLDPGCGGHRHRCTDWEMAQTYRSWRQRYGNEAWQDKFLDRYEKEMREKNDTHFYVGTHSLYPTWIIVGLFYPPRTLQSPLF